MKTKLFLTGLAFIAFTSIAMAQTTKAENNQAAAPGRGVAYVDENKNGICDNFENRSGNRGSNAGYCFRGGKENGPNGANCCGRGPSRGMGQGQKKGRNFVDNNNNGVCDNFEKKTSK